MSKPSPEPGFDPASPHLKNRVVILNGFSDQEIIEIMRQIKGMCKSEAAPEAPIDAPRSALIFARTTSQSLQTPLGELIVDLSEDHEYLQKNPPHQRGTPS